MVEKWTQHQLRSCPWG